MHEPRNAWAFPGNYPPRTVPLEQLAAEFQRRGPGARNCIGEPREVVTMHIAIDVKAALDPQLAALAREIRATVAQRRGHARHRRPNVPRLIKALRVLDAHRAGAEPLDIARVLFPDAAKPLRSVREALQLADEMISGGFAELAPRGPIIQLNSSSVTPVRVVPNLDVYKEKETCSEC